MGGFDLGSILHDILPALITGGATGVASYLKPEAPIAYGNTQAGFDAQQALEREKLAQEKELYMLKLGQGGGGGGSGAALAAANLAYKSNMAQLREKTIADRLSLLLSGQKQYQDTMGSANAGVVQAAQALGNAGQQGFGGISNFLSAYRGR